MSAPFKTGDRVRHISSTLGPGSIRDGVDSPPFNIPCWRVTLDRGGQVVWEERNIRLATPPPAPKAEGHVLHPVCHKCNDTGKVYHAAKDPLIMGSRVENCSCKAAPKAERETVRDQRHVFREGDVVYADGLGQATTIEPCSNTEWRVRLRGGGLDVWVTDAMRLVSTTPAPAPEPAKEPTGGERACLAFYTRLYNGGSVPTWSSLSSAVHESWEAAADAALAAIPPPRGERETVGYYLRDMRDPAGNEEWFSSEGWTGKGQRGTPVPRSEALAERELFQSFWSIERAEFSLVRVTRARRVPT